MSETFRKSHQEMLQALPSATSSQESADGVTPCNSQAGLFTGLFGQALVPANPSVQQGKAKAKKTRAISGRISLGSSASVALSSSLASKLMARLDSVGLMEYRQTWKRKRTPLGRVFWAHTAQARRILGSDCTGWPTPEAKDLERLQARRAECKERTGNGNGFGLTLGQAVPLWLAGWGTPNCMDSLPSGNLEARKKKGGCANLKDQALLAGWPTPKVAQGDYQYSNGNHETKALNLSGAAKLAGWGTPTAEAAIRSEEFGKGRSPQPHEVLTLGITSPSSPAQTEKRGALNPAHSRWLMGFPVGWDSCGATAMQSCRKSRQNSSKRQSKRLKSKEGGNE